MNQRLPPPPPVPPAPEPEERKGTTVPPPPLKGTVVPPPPPPQPKGATVPPPPIKPKGAVKPPPPLKGTRQPPPPLPSSDGPQPGDVWEHKCSDKVIKRLVLRRWRYKGVDKLQYIDLDDVGQSCVTTAWRFLRWTPDFVASNHPIDLDKYPTETAHDLTELSYSDIQILREIDKKNPCDWTEIEKSELGRLARITTKVRKQAWTHTASALTRKGA